MKNPLIDILLFLSLPRNMQAQTADSLKLLMKTEIEDTDAVLLMAELAEIYRYTNPDIPFSLHSRDVHLQGLSDLLKGKPAV